MPKTQSTTREGFIVTVSHFGDELRSVGISHPNRPALLLANAVITEIRATELEAYINCGIWISEKIASDKALSVTVDTEHNLDIIPYSASETELIAEYLVPFAKQNFAEFKREWDKMVDIVNSLNI